MVTTPLIPSNPIQVIDLSVFVEEVGLYQQSAHTCKLVVLQAVHVLFAFPPK